MDNQSKPKKMNFKVLILVILGTIVWMAIFVFASGLLDKLGDIGKILAFLLMLYMMWIVFRLIEGKKEIVVGYSKKKKKC